jgi:hypothetical protein
MIYLPAWPCHTHQKVCEAKMKGKRSFALLMAMRTGKTKTAIDDFGEMELASEVHDLLVLAPTGVYRTWREEIEKHAAAELLHRLTIHTWETKGGAGHDKALARFLARDRDPCRPRVLLANIEGTSSVDRLRGVLRTFVRQRRAEVIVDESTTIKSHEAERTKFVVKSLRPQSSYRRILCGLPTPKDPLDLFGQFCFLDQDILGYGFNEFTLFRSYYAHVVRHQFVGAKWPTDLVVAFKNLDDLYERIAPHSYRIRLEDIVDLPTTWQIREVELSDDQRKAYDSMKRDAFAKLGDGLVTAQLVIVQMLRLHQMLMGYVRDADGVIRELPEKRTEALLSLLEEYDGKAIIWCSYDYSVRKVSAALIKRYGEGSVARFWGGNSETREEDDKRFKTDPICRFMIATAGSGGRGRTWDVADLVVYYSSTNNLEHRDQSQERAKVMTKKNATAYVDLIAPGTVDEKIIRALRKKMDLARTITRDNYREWLI